MAKKEDYGSRFLYSEDLLMDGEYKTVSVTIDKYYPPGSMSAADKTLITKPSLGFAGKDKILVLCKTNSSMVHFITGEPPGEKWIGKSITLQVRIVDSFGEKVPAIRVVPPQGLHVRKKLIDRLGVRAVWKQ